ncbi:MAG: exodeoxyribonuclease-3 [Saprospiraceae bacterium]|jgi:exodeoxyribonuclease-3|tara:strand:+ start:2171 stop:2935 length:765 start_codon:yes stop_codon:yes gene_type:complete
MKIVSWNVNGVRAAVKKDFIAEVNKSKADIYCIQETKAQDDQVLEALTDLKGYRINVTSAEKKGYSGVSIFSKEEPISVITGIDIEEHDNEGRVICAEFEKFFLVNVYVPNSGSGLKRLEYRATWDVAFADYLAELRKTKPVVVTGDFNVAHQAVDLARPKPNYNKTSGYTQVEIDGISNILDKGFVDAYRSLYPEKVEYSFWSVRFGARAKNVGWRIDYFLVDESFKENIVESRIHTQIMGSDHCPISLELKF